MNSDETVEQVADKVFKRIQMSRDTDSKCGHLLSDVVLQFRRVVEANAEDYCTRMLAAHKREIGERDGERKGILKANESLAADNTRLREVIAAKDDEIARLNEQIVVHDCWADEECEAADTSRMCAENELRALAKELADEVTARDAEISKLRSLVKELADALECAISGFAEEAVTYGSAFRLVAKAREVVK